MSARSRSKGIRGELELAQFLRDRGIEARRGCQRRGGPYSPDVDADLEPFHVEVKRTERLALYPALDQARRDGGPERIPIVFHRTNRREWVAILPADALVELYRTARQAHAESEGAEC